MNQKNGRTDPGPLRERARSLFISQATIDETLEWATPRQLAAIDRMLATELANREASKRARLMRQARFPVLFCFNVCSTGSAVFFRSVG